MGGRQNFSTEVEISSQDLNTISANTERLLFDKVLSELMGRQTEGFFQDGLTVSRVSNTNVNVLAGLGFQFLATASPEPSMKPLLLASNSNQIIPTADPTNDRIDLIVAKAVLNDGLTASRKFKDFATQVITSSSTPIQKLWEVEFQIVAGTPSGSPVAPSVPAGYVNLAEILVTAGVGVAASGDITDKRVLLPLAGSVGATGSSEYDAIVGDTSGLGFSHETLKAVFDDPAFADGWSILVTRNESVADIPECAKNNVKIKFKRGVTFTDSGATVGLRLNGNGNEVDGGRFDGFTTCIDIVGGKNYNNIRSSRFLNHTTDIAGLALKNIESGTIEE